MTARPPKAPPDVPRWFRDERYALDFGQMTEALRDALLQFWRAHPWLRVAESFSSRYYLGMYNSPSDPQTVVVEMWPNDSAFPRARRTYAELNAAHGSLRSLLADGGEGEK
jgi:hypothetical protein